MKSAFQNETIWLKGDADFVRRGLPKGDRNEFGFPYLDGEAESFHHECQDYDEVEYYHSINKREDQE